MGIIVIILIVIVVCLALRSNKLNVSESNPAISAGQPTGIPSVKKYKTDKSEAQRHLKILEESYHLVKTTIKPDIFFGRFGVCFDCVLNLMEFKSSVFASGCNPEIQYQTFISDMESIVDDFIMRSYKATIEKANELKTEKAKRNRMEKYFTDMLAAFSNANSFWEGSSGGKHYTGKLYTGNNLKKIEKLNNEYILSLVKDK